MKVKTARPVAKLREGRNDWYRIQNLAGTGAAEIWIYEEIGYWGVTGADFVRELVAIDAERIDVHINTPGGDVFDGLAIYQALRNHPAQITTYVDSLAASCGSFIAMAGDVRLIAPHASMMIHDAWGLCIGGAQDMAKMSDELARISDNLAAIYATRSGRGDKESWRAAMLAETWYSADEAVAAGLAQRVQKDAKATVAPDGGQGSENLWDLSIFNFAGRDNAPAPQIPKQAEVPESDGPAEKQAANPAPESDTPSALELPAAEPGPTPTQEDDMSLSTEVRQRLGLDDTADEAAVLAALDDVVDKATAPPVTEPAPVIASADPKPDPVSEQALAEISRLSAELADIKASAAADAKKAFFDSAVRAGKISPADRAVWEARYDQSAQFTTEIVSAMADGNAVPVASAGYTGGEDPETSTDAAFEADMARLDPPTFKKEA